MGIERIRSAIASARANDGKVDVGELDRALIEARDQGGVDEAERAELLRLADGFDDEVKARLYQHLAAVGQRAAHVSLEAEGRITGVKGRYATLETEVPGLHAKLGLFDNTFALSGRARSDGNLSLHIDGRPVSVPVRAGDRPAALLERVRAQLPPEMVGLVFSGDARLHDPEDFNGMLPRRKDESAHLTMYKPAALGLQPDEKPLRVMVTGYGPFMGIENNPSDALARQLAQMGARGAVVEYRRLDVTHSAVDQFVEELRRNPPDVVLSMGVSSRAQVEERPENRVSGGVDGKNRPITPGVVLPGGDKELRTDLPLDTINRALDERFGAQRKVGSSANDLLYSPDRSAYLCNYLGYQLAAAFGRSDATTAGFVHITPDTPIEQMHSLLEAVVTRQLEQRRQHPTS
ncbi:MAG: hypothetical protein ACOZIN_18510 [Myxococcota bacterium]